MEKGTLGLLYATKFQIQFTIDEKRFMKKDVLN